MIRTVDCGDCGVGDQVGWSSLNADFWNKDCLIRLGYLVKLLDNLADPRYLASAVLVSRYIKTQT